MLVLPSVSRAESFSGVWCSWRPWPRVSPSSTRKLIPAFPRSLSMGLQASPSLPRTPLPSRRRCAPCSIARKPARHMGVLACSALEQNIPSNNWRIAPSKSMNQFCNSRYSPKLARSGSSGPVFFRVSGSSTTVTGLAVVVFSGPLAQTISTRNCPVSTLLIVLFCCSLLLSAFLTRFVRDLAHARGWLETPVLDRHVHTIPLPRIGGVAIFASFSVVVASCLAVAAYVHSSLTSPLGPTLKLMAPALICLSPRPL